MGVPRSVVRFKKDNIEVVDNCDAVMYTMNELVRAALRDVGKYITRQTNKKAQQLHGLKHNRRVRGRTSTFQYWVRKIECDCQIGIKHGTWYGEEQELGTHEMPKLSLITNTVYENIPTIIELESHYLSALSGSQASALSKCNENEYLGGGEDD